MFGKRSWVAKKKTPDIVKTYKKYREVSRELNDNIVNSYMDEDVIDGVSKLFGIREGNTLVLESEDEGDILMDFAIHDYRVDNKNAIEIYQETTGGKNDVEKTLLNAYLASYTSLFKINSVLPSESALILTDSLNNKDEIKLIDIGFSQSAKPDYLLFTRVVQLPELNMTSGMAFIFPGESERYLLKQYKILGKKVKSNNEAIKRFVAFFKLNRTDGAEVMFV